ncbi:MAG: DUF736 family protein [Erysipelotrichaceae bacterium]
MRNVEKKPADTAKKEFNLEEAFVLWMKEGKSGKIYYSGALTCNGQNAGIVCYVNGKKKNPKEPDYRVYLSTKKGEELGKEIASLWTKTSKKGTQYLSGKSDDGEFLTGFVTPDCKPGDKKPAFRVYFEANKNK